MCFPMSLRWTSYVSPKPPRGSKTQNSRFPCKIALRLKKVCYKVSLCENCQRQNCKAFIDLSIRAKMLGGERPLSRKKFGGYWLTHLQNADFQSIFARSASAVAPRKKIQLTIMKSTTHFPISLRWTSYVAPKPPKSGDSELDGQYVSLSLTLHESMNAVSAACSYW